MISSKRYWPTLIVMVLLEYLTSCTTTKKMISLKAGSYTVSVLRSAGPNAVICGRLYCFESKAPLGTNGAISMDKKIIARTDTNGNFKISIKPGKYRLTGFGMPYQFLTMKSINVAKGDSVRIIMYLKAA